MKVAQTIGAKPRRSALLNRKTMTGLAMRCHSTEICSRLVRLTFKMMTSTTRARRFCLNAPLVLKVTSWRCLLCWRRILKVKKGLGAAFWWLGQTRSMLEHLNLKRWRSMPGRSIGLIERRGLSAVCRESGK